jgi:hypothetical protein
MTYTPSSLALVFSVLTDVADVEYALLDGHMCITFASPDLRTVLGLPDEKDDLMEFRPTLFDKHQLSKDGYVEHLWIAGIGEDARLLCARLIDLGESDPCEAALLIVHPRYESEAELAASRLAISDTYDSLHQTLFAARIIAESVTRLMSEDPREAYQDMQALNDLLTTAMREVRLGLVELHPHEKFEKPLHHLLDDLVTTIGIREHILTEIHVKSETVQRPNLPYNVHVMLYRAVQVLLQIVTKQTHCQMIHITVIYKQQSVSLTVDALASGIPHQFIQEDLTLRLEEIDGRLVYAEQPDGVSVRIAWGNEKAANYDE